MELENSEKKKNFVWRLSICQTLFVAYNVGVEFIFTSKG